MSIELLALGSILLLGNVATIYFICSIFFKKIENFKNKDNNESIETKIELLKEQIKLSTIIIQNNSILISKNKKDLDTFEAFIKAALITNDDDVIH